MFVGGDQGFSSFWVVVLLLLAQVIFTILVSRKWRHEVAKREEIKKLLALAAKEEAREELETSTRYGCSYGYQNTFASESVATAASESLSRRVQYQCAVCFSRATTRCSRCKSARYCSGKCQIIHWRKGHKEKCQPITSAHQFKEMRVDSNEKEKELEEYEVEHEEFQTHVNLCAEPVQTLFEAATISNPVHSEGLNNKIQTERLYDEKFPCSASKPSSGSFAVRILSTSSSLDTCTDGGIKNLEHFSSLDEHLLDDVHTNKVVADCDDVVKKKSTTSVQAADNDSEDIKMSDTGNQIKPSSDSGDTYHGSSGSSTLIIDDCKGSFESRRPSHDFWKGTVVSPTPLNRNLSISNVHSLSKSVDNCDMSNSELSMSLDSSINVTPSKDVQSSDAKLVMSYDSKPSCVANKKPRAAALTDEISSVTINNVKVSSLNSEMPRNMDTDYSHSVTMKHLAPCVSCAHRASSALRCPPIKGVVQDCGSCLSSNDVSNHIISDTSNISYSQKSTEVSSMSCNMNEPHSSLRNGLHSVRSGKSLDIDGSDESTACASQLIGGSAISGNGLKTSVSKVVNQFEASKPSPCYQYKKESGMTERYCGKELFSYKQFVELYNWKKCELRPFGLTNCGNSCFANAVLQCLMHTPPLTAYLIQGFHSKSCKSREWCFTCELESLVLKAKAGYSLLSPTGILSQIGNSGSHLGHGREEDAHEFLRYAIDTMQAVCFTEAGVCGPSMLEEDTSLMGLTFGGYLRSKVRCTKCGGKSKRHEKMMDLTVEIEGNIETLEGALRQFTGTEILDGENKYYCNRCKSCERAEKKLSILESPNILTIALKRFQSGKFGKLNKSVQFPEILDMTPFISRTSDKYPIYQLYGVVVHLDIMNASFTGHYVCYVRNSQNKWYKLDDSVVRAVELETVLEKGAYMLLYARCSPRAPRLIRNSIIPHDLKEPGSMTDKFKPPQPCLRHIPTAGSLNDSADPECFLRNHPSVHPIKRSPEVDLSSENGSSIFTEATSLSTDSSNRDSSSSEDNFDLAFADFIPYGNSPRWSSSDSDTSSSSSSASPMLRQKKVAADLDRFFSRHPDNNGSNKNGDEESTVHRDGLWTRTTTHRRNKLENSESIRSDSFLHSDSTKQQPRMLASFYCSETNCNRRLDEVNPFDKLKSGERVGRSLRERPD